MKLTTLILLGFTIVAVTECFTIAILIRQSDNIHELQQEVIRLQDYQTKP